jgi:regulator of cell morphogenesis and NO signaling
LNNLNGTQKVSENYDRWSLDFLTDYIFNRHHQYYYDEAPAIFELLTKVANHHGDRYPELLGVYQLYSKLSQNWIHILPRRKGLVSFYKSTGSYKADGDVQQLKKAIRFICTN